MVWVFGFRVVGRGDEGDPVLGPAGGGFEVSGFRVSGFKVYFGFKAFWRWGLMVPGTVGLRV